MTDSTAPSRHRLCPSFTYLRLKAEFRGTVSGVGGLKEAAGITRGTIATLQRQYDPARIDHFPAIDAVLDLELTTGVPRVVRMMAECLGYRLVPASAVPAPAAASPGVQTLVVMKEVGEYAGAVAEMDADGVRTITELRRAIKEGEEAKEAIETSLDALYRELAAAMTRAENREDGP